jgi:hypothetical protein
MVTVEARPATETTVSRELLGRNFEHIFFSAVCRSQVKEEATNIRFGLLNETLTAMYEVISFPECGEPTTYLIVRPKGGSPAGEGPAQTDVG